MKFDGHIELPDQELVERALKWFKDDFSSEKVIAFERFIYETLLVELIVFTNMLLQSLLRFDSAVLGRFLKERGDCKSSILPYGLDFYITVGHDVAYTVINSPSSIISITREENSRNAFSSGIF